MKKKWIILIIVVVLLVISGLIWWLLIPFSCLATTINVLFGEENGGKAEFVKMLGTIIAGGLAFWGIWYTAKRVKALDKQNEIADKGKIDDRFKNAIEHFGDEKSPTKVLGGIYSMHQIARDHKDYRKTVFEILCSYIRETTASQKLWSTMTEEEQKNFRTPIPIQTCIDLLFKYTDEEDAIYKGLRANLQGIRCPKANFGFAHLEGADLRGANFEGADLWEAHLEHTYLDQAHFDEIHSHEAYFCSQH